MITVAPSTSFEAVVDLVTTGLTPGVLIMDNAGATTVARTTTGITEYPGGSGIYAKVLTSPAAVGQYTVVWDTGTVAPGNMAIEDLIVSNTASGSAAISSGTRYELASSTAVGATSMTIDRAATLPLAVGAIVLISAYTTRAELKSVTSVSSTTIGFTATKTAHTAGDIIIVLTGDFRVSPLMYGCVTGATDNWAPLQRCVSECAAMLIKLGHTEALGVNVFQVSQPVVVATSSQWDNMGFATHSTYAPVDANGAMVMVTTRGPYAFTCTASNDTFTVAGGHGLTNAFVVANSTPCVFNAPYGETLPTGITAGKVYYVLTAPDANTFTISTTFGGATLNITADGTGWAATQVGKLARTYWDNLRIDLSKADVNGLLVDMQQPAYITNLRIEMDVAATTEGTVYGAIIGGQIGYVENVEINPSAKCRGLKIGGSGMVFRGFNCNGVNSADTGIEIVNADNPSIWDPWTEQCGNAGILITSGRGIHIGGTWLQAVSNTTSPALKVVDAQAPYQVGMIRVPGTGYKILEDTARNITLGATGYTVAAAAATDYQSVFHGLVQPGTNFGTLQVHAPQLKGRVRIPVTANYVVRYIDEQLIVDSTSGTRTLSLPVAAGWAGTTYTVGHWAGANVCTIDTAGAETIDGSASVTVPAGGTTVVVSDGTNYQIISERA